MVLDAIHRREMPWLVIDTIHNVKVLVENKEIQSAMIGKVPAIVRSIQEDSEPQRVISEIRFVKVLVENKEIQSTIAYAIRIKPDPWWVICTISDVKVLVKNKEIESAMIRRIPYIADWIRSGKNKADVARGIMPIKVLRENKAIQEAFREGELRDGFY